MNQEHADRVDADLLLQVSAVTRSLDAAISEGVRLRFGDATTRLFGVNPMSERAEDQNFADGLRERYLALANAPRASMGDAFYRHQLRKNPAPVVSPDLTPYVDTLFDCEPI